MFGRILGKIVAAPLRIANLPLAISDKLIGGDGDPAGIKEVAKAVEDEVADSFGEEDEGR